MQALPAKPNPAQAAPKSDPTWASSLTLHDFFENGKCLQNRALERNFDKQQLLSMECSLPSAVSFIFLDLVFCCIQRANCLHITVLKYTSFHCRTNIMNR